MTQEAIQLRTTPPYPGLQMVLDANGALATIATDFAGASDPAGFANAYMTWADTANNLIKRRNAANTEWIQEQVLLRAHVPSMPLAELPSQNIGLIFVPGDGFYQWVSGAYAKSDLSFSVISTLKTQAAAIFGVGQSWQNVTASRAANGTTYTNSTPKPIMVAVSHNAAAPNISYLVNVDGLMMARPNWPDTYSGGAIAVSFWVPPGSTYSVLGTGVTAMAWREYR